MDNKVNDMCYEKSLEINYKRVSGAKWRSKADLQPDEVKITFYRALNTVRSPNLT